MIEAAFTDPQPLLGTKPACDLLGKSRATHYRRCRPRATRAAATVRVNTALASVRVERIRLARNSPRRCRPVRAPALATRLLSPSANPRAACAGTMTYGRPCPVPDLQRMIMLDRA